MGHSARQWIDGVWDFRTATPLQRSAELARTPRLSAGEASAYEERLKAARAVALQKRPAVHAPEWLDYGTRLQPDGRTSLVIDPPDGRIPARTRQSETRARAKRERRGGSADGPESRSLWERCLVGFNAGPPMNPGAYNNTVRILPTDDSVLIVTEMVHEARVVRLVAVDDAEGSTGGDRSDAPGGPSLQYWQGDSRGYWQGDELVVETTGFRSQTSFMGSGQLMRIVERFAPGRDGSLEYTYTIDDPESFSHPFTVRVVMVPGGPMYEYACHEGNYALLHILQAARAADRAPE